jgi:DNA polymerase-1
VPKCGPKTAAKWLNEYGSLDAVIAHADEVKGKIGENLRAALPQLPLSRQLATIKLDVALDAGPRDLVFRARDIEALRKLYTRYEFRQGLKHLDALATQAPSAATPAAVAPDDTKATTDYSPHPAAHPSAIGYADVPSGILPPQSGSPPRDVGYDAATTVAAKPSTPASYELVVTQPQLDAWLARLRNAPLIAFDTETSTLDPLQADLVGLSFAVEPGKACYIPVGHVYPGAPAQLDRDAVLAALKPVLEDADRSKVGQHAKYDCNVLSSYGINVQGIAFDTMLESYVLNPTASRHDMDTLAKRWLDYDTVHFEDVAGKGAKQISFAQVDLDTACRCAAEDADVTLRLHQALWPELAKQPALQKVFTDIEMPLVPVLARMEQRGVLIDVAALRRQSQQLGKRMLAQQTQMHALAGREFNVDSTKQLRELLFDELGLPVRVKTPTGQPSTIEEAL